MKKSINLEIDLLKNRRENYGLKSPEEVSTHDLKQKGIYIGSIIIAIGIISAISIGIYSSSLEKKSIELSEKAKQYDLLKLQFEKELVSLKKIYATNDQIADGIVGIRSGSALLSDLKEIIPAKVQLTSIDTRKNIFQLTGISPQPFGLNVINSMKLQLENSFFLDSNNVSFIRIWEIKKNDNKKAKAYMTFNLKAGFTNKKKAKKIFNYMEKLGSFGLAKRISILNQEGLIKWQIYTKNKEKEKN